MKRMEQPKMRQHQVHTRPEAENMEINKKSKYLIIKL